MALLCCFLLFFFPNDLIAFYCSHVGMLLSRGIELYFLFVLCVGFPFIQCLSLFLPPATGAHLFLTAFDLLWFSVFV